MTDQRGRRMRRGYPILGYIGPNGSGKTLAMIHDTIPSLRAGRPVLSTVRLLDFDDPRPCDDPLCETPDHAWHLAAHPLYTRFTNWRQLMDWRGGDVLMDEVAGIASARASASMPQAVETHLQQLRRHDVFLRWSAPAWGRADVIIRECSQAVCVARGFLPVAAVDAEGVERIWRHKRAFKWVLFDRAEFDDWSNAKREKLRPLARSWFWGPGSEAFRSYDTFDAVSMIDGVSDAGRCLNCGGRRTAPSCSCADYVAPPRVRRVPVVST